MKRKLVFATNNAHKLEEVSAILGDKVELLSLNDINCHTDIPENSRDFLKQCIPQIIFYLPELRIKLLCR